jgi:hypothetical protein
MKVLTIGKRLISTDQIALVEPFDPKANPEFRPEKDFKARIILLNRNAVLTEHTVAAFAEEHELHLLKDDDVAIKRGVFFKVESFTPSEKFNPIKPYLTRLKWVDPTGTDQSKPLVMSPEAVMAEILGTKAETPAKKPAARRPARGRRGGAPVEAAHR